MRMTASAVVRSLKRVLLQTQSEVRKASENTAALESELVEVRRQARGTMRGRTAYLLRRQAYRRMAELAKEILEAREAEKSTSEAIPKATNDLSKARGELVAKQTALTALERDRRVAVRRAESKWLWLAPQLNGKVVAVVDRLEGSTLLPAWGSEEKAVALLSKAYLHIHNRSYRAGRAKLNELIHLYPATNAAAEGRNLLLTLPPQNKPV